MTTVTSAQIDAARIALAAHLDYSIELIGWDGRRLLGSFARAEYIIEALRPLVEQYAPTAEDTVLVEASLNLYRIDIALAPMYRSLEPARFKALHDRLVVLGQIDPEKDADFWKNEAEDES